MKFVGLHEWANKPDGQYTNNPADPGGETRFGISKRAHPDADIKNLTIEGALDIYKSEYWDFFKLDSFDLPLNIALMDAFVQHNPQRVKIMQSNANNDWKAFIDQRRQYYLGLIQKNPALARFKNGWLNRMNDLSKYCQICLDNKNPA